MWGGTTGSGPWYLDGSGIPKEMEQDEEKAWRQMRSEAGGAPVGIHLQIIHLKEEMNLDSALKVLGEKVMLKG